MTSPLRLPFKTIILSGDERDPLTLNVSKIILVLEPTSQSSCCFRRSRDSFSHLSAGLVQEPQSSPEAAARRLEGQIFLVAVSKLSVRVHPEAPQRRLLTNAASAGQRDVTDPRRTHLITAIIGFKQNYL